LLPRCVQGCVQFQFFRSVACKLCFGGMGHAISFGNRDIVLFPCCLCNLLHVHEYLLLGKKIGTFRKSFDSLNLNSYAFLRAHFDCNQTITHISWLINIVTAALIAYQKIL
jgi:hypothetical protein